MAVIPSRSVDRIAEGVARAPAELTSDVVRMRYSLGEDWSGGDAVLFRVLLKDASIERSRLRQVARHVTDTIFRAAGPQELGLQAYFNFSHRV